jgi:hypothetical protein
LRAISKEIRLDPAEMFNNESSIYHVYYNEKNFTYIPETKRYHVNGLLKIGFLLCEHYSSDTQGVDLWHLINPKLEQTVPRDQVIELMKDLVYVAVDMNIKYLSVMGDRLKDMGTKDKTNVATKESKEVEKMKNRALKYLDTAKKNSPKLIEDMAKLLPPHVSKIDLIPVMKKQMFRSHQIRTLLTNNYQDDDESNLSEIKDIKQKYKK